jgi:hypothetical protein
MCQPIPTTFSLRIDFAPHYVDGGVGNHFFKVADVKALTPSQVNGAIGDLAGSSGRVTGVAVVTRETLEAAGFEESELFLTEYVSRQQGIKPSFVKEIPKPAPAPQAPR